MKNKLAITAIGSVIISALNPAFAEPPADSDWVLVWSDEFDGEQLDATKWGSGSTPWGSEAQSSCTLIPAEDTYLQDGHLVNRSRLGPVVGPSGKEFKYTSGWAWSRTWLTYGYLEIRAKYPDHRGAWPAWWMLREGWPPEFDIAEYRGEPRGYMTHALFDEARQWTTTHTRKDGGEDGEPIDFTDWHVYGFEWSPGRVRYYIDGQLKHDVEDPDVPAQAMYVILSNGTSCDDGDGTGFPNYYTIDYFRWYQHAPTDQPVAPTDLTATIEEHGTVLKWTAPPDTPAATRYTVQRADGPDAPFEEIAAGAFGSTFTDVNSTKPGTRYVVVAQNDHGPSQASTETSAEKPSDPPS